MKDILNSAKYGLLIGACISAFGWLLELIFGSEWTLRIFYGLGWGMGMGLTVIGVAVFVFFIIHGIVEYYRWR